MKDRLTPSFCGNASYVCKLKPLLVYIQKLLDLDFLAETMRLKINCVR